MSAKSDDYKELLAIAYEFLEVVTSELDPYSKEKGIVKMGESEVFLFTPSHIQFAIYGRGPGKKPPLDNILSWVKQEGIIFDKKDERGTAFAIQASIGQKGTSNWVPGAPNALEESLRKHYSEFQKELAKSLVVKINDQVNNIYKQINFEKIV